jgi:hypothetical protein
MTPKRTAAWNITSPDDVPEPKEGEGKPEIAGGAREKARWSLAGGRIQCFFCKVVFGDNYCRFVRITLFRNEHACRDCIKQKNLSVLEDIK